MLHGLEMEIKISDHNACMCDNVQLIEYCGRGGLDSLWRSRESLDDSLCYSQISIAVVKQLEIVREILT